MRVVLYQVRRGATTTIGAIGDDNGCDLLTFLRQQKVRAPGELAKLARLLDYTAAAGAPANEQKFRHLGDGLYEFKADSLRVVCFQEPGRLILCSHGFVKKQQKTPRAQIAKAEAVRARYEAARRAGTVISRKG